MLKGIANVFKKKEPESPIDPVEEFKKKQGKCDIVKFNALEVTDFSSQYGSETSISYTASNLAGRGNIYPNYGDFTQACVFRTYGIWWDIAPSRRKSFKRTPPSFCSQDYIEVVFQKKVFPIKLDIYETYNPGCIVRILACERSTGTDVDTGLIQTRWKTLWEAEPKIVPQQPRVFSPPLNECPFATDLIRLELCHKLVYYYTELDSVELTGNDTHGKDINVQSGKANEKGGNSTALKNQMTIATKQLEKLTLETDCDKDAIQNTKEINSDNPVEKQTSKDTPVERQTSKDSPKSDNGYFDLLPEEGIQLILSFLDVLSLCRVARTCQLLYKHSYDSLQYTELNLQPHWTQVNDIALDSMHGRSRFLQSLNLSWCHENIVSENAFCSYIKTCGSSLKCLYLSSCSFVSNVGVEVIANNCPNLTELDLDSCLKIPTDGFNHISSLSKIERLNLYRTNIGQEAMLDIIVSCPELRHLNIGSTSCIVNFDDILAALGTHSRYLKSLDVWRSRNVSDAGVMKLADGCFDLEELDLGWCSNVKSPSNSIVYLVTHCTKLKKLFLTANRAVCDTDLEAIAENCKDLEQLDILGTRQVTAEKAARVLKSCTKMVLFDVSFCSGIDDYTVKQWGDHFPNVDVKKSFQNSV